jgi:hypothetical protein
MKKLSFILISFALFISGCAKHLSNLNIDPKSSSSAIPTALFLQGEKSLVDAMTSTSVASAPFRVLSQEWTENSYTYEANYNLAVYKSPDGWWNALYVNVLHNLGQAKLSFPVNYKGDPAVLRNELDITDLLQVYAYYLLVGTYGDVPYTEAQNTEIPFPKYDDAKTIYADLLVRVDSSIKGISTTAGAMGSADQIYQGNTTEWLKFGASLELKLAMLIADEDPTTAAQKVNNAIQTGVFTSDSDDALFTYDAASPVNSNPIWNALVLSGRHDFAPSSLLVNTMVGLNDPRLPFYFTQYPANSGMYKGGSPGAGNGYGTTSDFASALQQPAYPGDILDYSEVQFYLAESVERGFITGSAATYYNNAITASIEFWGGTAAQATAYLAQPSVAYATATGPWQQKIGYQEWISFYNRNWDSWTVIRRLGYPNINVVSVPVNAEGTLPLRYYYPTNETTSNPINWAAAVAKIPGGKDVVSAKLFWEK